MKVFITTLFVLIIASCGTIEHKKPPKKEDEIIIKTLADTDQRLLDFCKQNHCRKNNSFKLIQNDKSIFDYSSELDPPAVQGEYISIFPNETLYIEAEETKSKPMNFIQVDKNNNPEKTIIFRFWQEADTEIPRMMLEVTNPFTKPIRYNLSIMDTVNYNLYKTSSCPVQGKMIEMWGDTIFQLLFENLRFLDDGEPMTCIK